MACCAVLAAVLGALRAIWFRLFPGRRPADPGFAPPARRTADGRAPETAPTPVRSRPPIAGSLLRGVVHGTVAYAAVVAALRASPLVRTLDGPWLARDIALVALAALALVGSLGLTPESHSRSAALVGAAGAWTELGLVDMHLLGLFEFRAAALPLDLLLHASGPLLVVVAARSLAVARPRPRASTA
jgi:hypothetical protein